MDTLTDGLLRLPPVLFALSIVGATLALVAIYGAVLFVLFSEI